MNDLKDRFTFRVRWEPFLLRPEVEAPGMYTEVNWNLPQIRHLVDAFNEEGLVANRGNWRPYTLWSHQLLDYAAKKDNGEKQDEVSELLFKALFSEAKQLQIKDLLEVAQAVGFDVKEVEALFQDEKHASQVKKNALSWSRQGISGVPFFIMNGKPAFSGAQDANTVKQMILKVAEKFPLETSSKV